MRNPRSILAICGVAICAAAAGWAQSPAPADTGTGQAPADFSQFKTADDLWAQIEKMEQGPGDPSAGADEVMALLQRLKAAAAEYQNRYPKDPRRWEAKLVELRFNSMMLAAKGDEANPADIESTLKEVAAAPDAAADARQEARISLISIHAAGQQPLSPDVEKEILAYIHDFPADTDDGQLQKMRLDSLKETDLAGEAKLLDALLKDPNPAVAAMAQGEAATRDLAKKPLELQFTAVDGTKVDLAKMRGKVMLVDFWATWCAPCMEEVPDVVKVYNEFHGQGFDVVGISLDQDKNLVEAVTKAQGMTWPQYFDGKMWDNEISSRYGISAIPTMWLLDKKGMVTDTSAEDDLEGKVKKLLAR
ncbi:MAG: TlpA disulfide reductase family protein [Chthoniobacteraceae bacterium]|jgi:thiol-disulfide isomerase/thioredoxin